MGLMTDVLFGTILGQVIFWFLLVIGLFFATFGVILYARHRKLRFPCYELVDLGNGKVHIETTRAGWLGSKTMMGKLIHYGKPLRMKMKDGRIIRDFSAEDYMMGHKGKVVVCESDPVDRDTVAPVANIRLDGEMFASMPPIDFRDAAIDNIKNAKNELKGYGETIMQLVVIGFIVVLSLVAIIMTTRYAQASVTEAGNLVRDNSNICVDSITKAVSSVLSQPSPDAP